MEKIILWSALIIGLVLLFYSLRRLPFKEWLIVYLMTSYFSIVLGVFVVEENMIDYPVMFLNRHFDSNLLFEYLWLPVFVIYFYITTYHSKNLGILIQGLLYTSVLTIIEVILEVNTNLIKYINWTWMYTFIGVFLLMIFIRYIIMIIFKQEK